MKLQEMFSDSYIAMMRQGKPSMSRNWISKYGATNNGLICTYRGTDGCKCMIGHLIPDENYIPKIENIGVGGTAVLSVIDEKYVSDDEQFSATNTAILEELQTIHDKAAEQSSKDNKRFLELFKENAEAFAEKHNLEMPFAG